MIETILFWSVFLWSCLWAVFEVLQGLLGARWFYCAVYLRTPSWRFSRCVAFFWKGRQCAKCGSRRFLDVHHKTYAHRWWEWLFVWDLEVLCRTCHTLEHKTFGRNS